MKKIAIACSGQAGDIMTALSCLKYKDELWGSDAEITWLADERYYDIFKFNPYLIVKQFPHGWKIPDFNIYAERIAKDRIEGKPEWEDLSLAMNPDGKVNQDLKNMFKSIAEFDQVYFPAPWQFPSTRRTGNYPVCSKKVFGVPDHYDWHPVLYWSNDEGRDAWEFMELYTNKKKVFIESYCGSGQSKLTHDMIQWTMDKCTEMWGECVFIFVSHKYLNNRPEYPESFFEDRIISAAHFTVRQCALIADQCDLFISVSSGISVASSAHGIKSFPILQYCGSAVCGTKEMANGECIQVFSDERSQESAETEYQQQLIYLLDKYK